MANSKPYTYRDFMNECANYQYSKEYYEILKETSEIMILEKYISNQKFIIESDTSFTEGYLMESTSNEDLVLYEKVLNGKKQNLFIRLLEGIRKLLDRFIAWISGIIDKLSVFSVEEIINPPIKAKDLHYDQAAIYREYVSNAFKEFYKNNNMDEETLNKLVDNTISGNVLNVNMNDDKNKFVLDIYQFDKLLQGVKGAIDSVQLKPAKHDLEILTSELSKLANKLSAATPLKINIRTFQQKVGQIPEKINSIKASKETIDTFVNKIINDKSYLSEFENELDKLTSEFSRLNIVLTSTVASTMARYNDLYVLLTKLTTSPEKVLEDYRKNKEK